MLNLVNVIDLHCKNNVPAQCLTVILMPISDSGMPSPFTAQSVGNSPFNQGMSLLQNPISSSMAGGGFQMNPMMGMGAGRNTLPSMFMNGQTLMMGGAARQRCLKHIVCPTYCHEIDENGCETCPCGPGKKSSEIEIIFFIIKCI